MTKQQYVLIDGVWVPTGGPPGAQGPQGATGAGAQYETCTLWADLPAGGNWLGRRIHVTSGLGFCVALWNGTAWVVAPESDTGWQNVTIATPAQFQTISISRIRRTGYTCQYQIRATVGTGTLAGGWSVVRYVLKPGWLADEYLNIGSVLRANDARPINISTTGDKTMLDFESSSVNIPAWAAAHSLTGRPQWTTADAWPTTAP